jgi:protein TonB
MRASALKKADTEIPVSVGSPESNRLLRMPVSPQRGAASPLSTFRHDERDHGTRRQRLGSYVLAAFLEVILLAGIWHFLERPAPKHDQDDAAEIAMVEAPPTPAPPKPVPPPPPPPKVVEPPKVVPKVFHVLPRPAPMVVPPMVLPPEIIAPPPPPPPPAPAVNAELVDKFQAEVRAAIQAAIIYPSTAKMMKQQGRAKVAFTLTHGHAEGAQLIQSSGVATIDTAALAAVRDASYPAPPPEMAGKPLSFAVFVVFSLASQ